MAPITLYSDTGAALANAIRDRFAEHAVNADVGNTIPKDRRPTENPRPLVVVVADQPGTIQSRASKRQPIRLLAYAATRDDAYDLIDQAHAFALAGGAGLRHVAPDAAPWVTADPDTGEPMGAATVTAYAIPTDI